MEISPPFQEEPDSASHELNAARAANSLAEDNSDPIHDEEVDQRASVSEAPPAPQLVTRPVSQLDRFTARSSANAAEPICAAELEASAEGLLNALKRLLST